MKLTQILRDDLVDSHCHLSDIAFDTNREGIINDAIDIGIKKIINIAVDIDSSKQTRKLAKIYKENVFASVGIHPEMFVPKLDENNLINHQKYQNFAEIYNEIKNLALSEEYIMIGECGLDYYWLQKNNFDEKLTAISKSNQQELFLIHCQIAQETSLPLTIHHRDSLGDCLKITQKYFGEITGIFHSFTGEYKDATKILDQGFGIGINAIIMYKSGQSIRETIKKITGGGKNLQSPEKLYKHNIFLESDSPYLSPDHKYPNKPSNIKILWNFIRDI
jgi:TatD DNase family protein